MHFSRDKPLVLRSAVGEKKKHQKQVYHNRLSRQKTTTFNAFRKHVHCTVYGLYEKMFLLEQGKGENKYSLTSQTQWMVSKNSSGVNFCTYHESTV